ncbi:MAG: tRNA-dependent cyclodipeptide synthase [Planctomycetota bacterium]
MKSDSNFDKFDLSCVSIAKTTPKVSEEQLFSHRRCYIGISIDNPVFYGSSLEALLLWGIKNFDQSLVIIGDYLRRFNEQIFNHLPVDKAVKAAQDAGDLFLLQTSQLLEQLPREKISITRWKPCLETDEYKKSRAILDELFDSDPNFKTAVVRDAFSFAKRQAKQKRTLAIPMEEAIELSSQYLMEEIAVFSALSEQGWNVELYPGPELRVLVEIARGKYSNIPQGLKKRINVELQICKSRAD